MCGRVAALRDGVLDQIGRRDDIGRVRAVDRANRERIGYEHHAVVGDALGDKAAAAHGIDHPGFVAVGDGIVARFARIAVTLEKLAGDFDGLTRGFGALGHEAAQEKGNTPVREIGAFRVKGASARVRADDEACFVRKALIK